MLNRLRASVLKATTAKHGEESPERQLLETSNAKKLSLKFYSPTCLGQETAKGPFGLRVKLPSVHLFTTHGGGFALSL